MVIDHRYVRYGGYEDWWINIDYGIYICVKAVDSSIQERQHLFSTILPNLHYSEESCIILHNSAWSCMNNCGWSITRAKPIVGWKPKMKTILKANVILLLYILNQIQKEQTPPKDMFGQGGNNNMFVLGATVGWYMAVVFEQCADLDFFFFLRLP